MKYNIIEPSINTIQPMTVFDVGRNCIVANIVQLLAHC